MVRDNPNLRYVEAHGTAHEHCGVIPARAAFFVGSISCWFMDCTV
jgi:hypothetical protein